MCVLQRLNYKQVPLSIFCELQQVSLVLVFPLQVNARVSATVAARCRLCVL